MGIKESNGDNDKILSLLHDLENQGQTLFCMTFYISGGKHDTNSIYISYVTSTVDNKIIIIIIWFGDTVTVSHSTKCDTNSKVRALS